MLPITLSRTCLIAVIALAACKPATEEPPSTASSANSSTAPSEPTAVTPQDIQGGLLELPISTQSGTAQLLSAGGTLSGQFSAPQAGNISSVHIQIGNFNGSSDGTAKLTVCEGAICQEGNTSIAGSADNSYLQFILPIPLTVEPGASVKYTFTRIDGEKPFAVWTYPTNSNSELTLADGSKAALDSKIALSY